MESPEPSGSGTRNGDRTGESTRQEEDWKKSKTGQRIAELNEVEENISRLLHFAGCTLASLHPSPLSSFTSQTVEFEEQDSSSSPTSESKVPSIGTSKERKGKEFSQYSEAFYGTLNDIQLSLRTSLRHLHTSHFTPQPLLDPSFHSLLTPGGGNVAVGGIALTGSSGGKGEVRLGVNALRVERDVWRGLREALGGVEGGGRKGEEGEKGEGEKEDGEEMSES